jgi:Tfp pilus assembly protein PilN
VPRRINLLPKTERVRTATNVSALAIMAGGVILLFALVLSYYLLSSSRSSLQDELAVLEGKRIKLEAQVASLNAYKVLAAEVSAKEGIVRGVYAGRTLVAEVLSNLSRAIPANVWITGMTNTAGDPQTVAGAAAQTPGALTSGIGSFTMQGNTYSFPDVALLLVRLRLVPSLQAIALNSAGEPIGEVDPTKNIRGFSILSSVVNTQLPDTSLPMSKVEVEGL